MTLTAIDWIIMLAYFVFVLGIGFALKRNVKTSTDFFLSARCMLIRVPFLSLARGR